MDPKSKLDISKEGPSYWQIMDGQRAAIDKHLASVRTTAALLMTKTNDQDKLDLAVKILEAFEFPYHVLLRDLDAAMRKDTGLSQEQHVCKNMAQLYGKLIEQSHPLVAKILPLVDDGKKPKLTCCTRFRSCFCFGLCKKTRKPSMGEQIRAYAAFPVKHYLEFVGMHSQEAILDYF